MDISDLGWVHQELHNKLRFPIWVITRPETEDYPGKWKARLHVCSPVPAVTNILIVGNSLEEVRSVLPEGLTLIPRFDNDDPVIEETWL
jgi:hypothetical protein